MEVCSFLNGWFVGSMLIFQGVSDRHDSQAFNSNSKSSCLCKASWVKSWSSTEGCQHDPIILKIPKLKLQEEMLEVRFEIYM